MKQKYKYVYGIQCPVCDEKLWSKYGHDFHHCECGYCFVDGGGNYLRYGWGLNSDGEYWNDWEVPQSVKFRVPEVDWLTSDRPRKNGRKLAGRFPY